ncbi:hypothetical protein BV25DRAFT_1784624, partial [Artomyces pyxidatus]
PFATKEDWQVAKWAIDGRLSHSMLKGLLSIPGVRKKLNVSYGSMKTVLKKVDQLPARAVWKSREVWFKDRPDDKHLIQYRDPLEAIEALLGNPAHKDNIVYRPSKVF